MRPALVFATTRKHAVIAFVTTSKKQSSTHSLTIPATRTTGLKQPSVVHCEKLATIDRSMILGELGALPQDIQKRADQALKTLFKV